MDLQLNGKRALVTGSSAGIGAAIAKRLAAEGVRVVLHGRDRPRLDKLALEIRSAGGEPFVTTGDLSTDQGAETVVRQTQAQVGSLDILICNAGVYPERTWRDAAASDWMDTYNRNVGPVVRMVRPFLPDMREARWGRVVLIASCVAWQPLATMADHSASKAALVNMAVSLAKDLAGSGVTANTVSPGIIVTDHARELFTAFARKSGWPTDWPSIEKNILAQVLPNSTGRLGQPEDVADLVAFVSSPLAGYINGANLRVDGGSTVSIN